MPDTAAALAWIVDLMNSRGIPFQAVGGLAAHAYGATRPIIDLDFYIPMQRYPEIEAELAPYLTRSPMHHRDEAWDLAFLQLVYAGQKIELGGVEDARYFDRTSGAWMPQNIDFSRSVWAELFAVQVPVMPLVELITYKRRLGREVDCQDLAQIQIPRPDLTDEPP